MLLQLIKKCGYTVNDVSKALKVGTRRIYDWADGISEPTLKQARQLSRFLGIDENELFN